MLSAAPIEDSMAKRILITAGLPYANGRIHLGHLVEYCQTDIYVRALKRLGEDAFYICASDAHGTPIEVSAKKQGITPEQLVAKVQVHQGEDLRRFGVEFDHFSSTHADSNRQLVTQVYNKLRAGGHLLDKETQGAYCEKDQRFLPDRFIRGSCPKCGEQDQYGDTCEKCHATYMPTDLSDSACVLCGTTPVLRPSTHVFFRLSDPAHSEFLAHWIDSGVMEPDVANFVRSWIDNGLLDWCISRDSPYFGFEIPDREGKFFYVWLDAPLGYAASSMEWGASRNLGQKELWQSDDTRIEHIIGKDIVYFHTLFWPAVLRAVGFSLPAKVHVHGMLTIDGQKMSKTRGTFINANTFAEHIEPEALRYYLACKSGPSSDDLSLSADDLVTRINAEVVNKHANLFSRAAQFLNTRLDGRLGDLPFPAGAALEPVEEGGADGQEADLMVNLARRVIGGCRKIEQHYRQREFSQVVRELAVIADIGNEFMQTRAPWVEIKTDPERARQTITFALNVCEVLANTLWPIMPEFCTAAARVLAVELGPLRVDRFFGLRKKSIGTMERLFERIDKKAMQRIIAASKVGGEPMSEGQPQVKPEKEASSSKKAQTPGLIRMQQFKDVELRMGKILSGEMVAKSDRLLRLMVDIGEESPRQIVAGVAQDYAVSELIDRRVVVVCNLAPATIRGVESQGMLLAADDQESLRLLFCDGEPAPGSRVS